MYNIFFGKRGGGARPPMFPLNLPLVCVVKVCIMKVCTVKVCIVHVSAVKICVVVTLTLSLKLSLTHPGACPMNTSMEKKPTHAVGK